MRIALNLVGVSYNDGTSGGRYRNYEDSVKALYEHVVNPLEADEDCSIDTYLYTYDNGRKHEILRNYQPVKYTFIDPTANTLGGGDRIHGGWKAMTRIYYDSLYVLEQNINDIDVIISTRFDIKFHKNPFETFKFDFNKFNFLWREPEFMHLPIVNDTFVVFPSRMLFDVIRSIEILENNPPHGVNIGMHNWYLPLVSLVGEQNVQWVCDDFKTLADNNLYTLMRNE